MKLASESLLELSGRLFCILAVKSNIRSVFRKNKTRYLTRWCLNLTLMVSRDYNTHLKKEKGGYSSLVSISREDLREIFLFAENRRFSYPDPKATLKVY